MDPPFFPPSVRGDRRKGRNFIDFYPDIFLFLYPLYSRRVAKQYKLSADFGG
jgi:hypothetical protein